MMPEDSVRPGQCRRAPGRPNLRGFTLIELAMVIVIIAILARIAVPRIADALVQHRLEAAARRVTNDLNLARQRASQSSAAQTVVFDLAASSYRIAGLPDPDCPTREYQVRLSDPPYEVQIASVDLGGDVQLVFDGYGTPDSGGTLTIQARRYQCTITVGAQTGLVTVSPVTTQTGGGGGGGGMEL